MYCTTFLLNLYQVLMEEMQRYLGVLRQLKDFDENLTREIAARAYQEQERVKLEVHVFNALTKNNTVEKL